MGEDAAVAVTSRLLPIAREAEYPLDLQALWYRYADCAPFGAVVSYPPPLHPLPAAARSQASRALRCDGTKGAYGRFRPRRVDRGENRGSGWNR